MIKLDITDLTVDPNELKARLSGDMTDKTLTAAAKALTELSAVADCSYCFKETNIYVNQSEVVLDFCGFHSQDLARNLKTASKAYAVAVTLGVSVDRLLQKKAVTGMTEHFIYDAVASALIEAACDKVQSLLPHKTGIRFSPGYGDLSLGLQAPLLSFLKADGIRLTESWLLVPSKSVTFIVREI